MMGFHRVIPGAPTGYALNPVRGYFSAVIATGQDNLVTNPSGEVDDNGYIGLAGGTVARTSDKAIRGAYSIRYTPTANATDGMYYPFDGSYTPSGNGPPRLTANTAHGIRADFLGASGVHYEFYLYDNIASRIVGRQEVTGKGYNEKTDWIEFGFGAISGAAGGSGTEHQVFIRKVNSTNTSPFYLDGLQVTPGRLTTYFDGDSVGFIPGRVDYLWNGARHNSTSTRSASTRSGGRVIRLDHLGLEVIGYTGLDMGPIENYATPLTNAAGSYYQKTRAASRPFSIIGVITGNPQERQRIKAQLVRTFRPDGVTIQQPMILRYQYTECDIALGPPVDFFCVYESGLEGNTDNLYQERVALSFTALQPFGYRDGDESLVTDGVIRFMDNDYIIGRKPSGDWSEFDNRGTNGPVYCMAYGPDGNIYIGGNFTTVTDDGGPVTVNHIAGWNRQTGHWFDLDLGVDGPVYALHFDSVGRLYVGGDFVNAGAIPLAVNYIALWDGSAWSALGGATPGLDDIVYTIEIDALAFVYVGGAFNTTADTLTVTPKIAVWDGTAWDTLGAGFNDTVRTLKVGYDGVSLYAGGLFTLSGLTTVNRVAYWTGGPAWASLGATPGTNGPVYAAEAMPDGTFVFVGNFSTAGGATLVGIARWNGIVWSGFGNGLAGSGGTPDIRAIAYDKTRGQLWVGGNQTNAGTVVTLDGLSVWNGSAWFVPDVDLTIPPAVAGIVYSLLAVPDGTICIGFEPNTDDAVVPTLFTASNNGSAAAYPRITLYRNGIDGDGFIWQIINYTTGDAIYFDDLQVLIGEIITINLDQRYKSVISSLRGDISWMVLPGSNLGTFRLLPGDNSIASLSRDSEVEVKLTWRPTHWGISNALPQIEAF